MSQKMEPDLSCKCSAWKVIRLFGLPAPPPRQRVKYGVWDRERGLGWGFHFLALDTKSYRAPFPPGFRIKFDAYRGGLVGG